MFSSTVLVVVHSSQLYRKMHSVNIQEWNALGERSTEWRDRGIIPNENLASGTDEPWSTWRSLNRLTVQKGRCRAMMKMWKLSHTDGCDCVERQTMSHLMTCGDAPKNTWQSQTRTISNTVIDSLRFGHPFARNLFGSVRVA